MSYFEEVRHPVVTWCVAILTYKAPRTIMVDFSCKECNDKTRRSYCCESIAKDHGFRNYIVLHSKCQKRG